MVLNVLPSMKTNEASALRIDVLHTIVRHRAYATVPLSPGSQRNAAEQGAIRRLLRADKLCSTAGQLHMVDGLARFAWQAAEALPVPPEPLPDTAGLLTPLWQAP